MLPSMLRANPTGRGFKRTVQKYPWAIGITPAHFFQLSCLASCGSPNKRRENSTSLFCVWAVFVWHTLPGTLCFQTSDRSQPFVKRTPQTFFLRPSQWQQAFNPSTRLWHSSSPPNLPHASLKLRLLTGISLWIKGLGLSFYQSHEKPEHRF